MFYLADVFSSCNSWRRGGGGLETGIKIYGNLCKKYEKKFLKLQYLGTK